VKGKMMTVYNKNRLVAEVASGKTLISVSREWAGKTIGYYLRDGDKVLKVNGKSFNSAVKELRTIKGFAWGYPRVKIERGMKWQFAREYHLLKGL
jgi:hypothetical protein